MGERRSIREHDRPSLIFFNNRLTFEDEDSFRDYAVSWRSRVDLLALIAVVAVLVLSQLGANCLWQDEGQTAVIAKNILKTGLPAASDGKNLVSIFADHRDIRDGIYIWQGWLPSYLAAGSMALLGRNSFAARLPFALLFVVLIFTYYDVLRRRGDRRQHLWLTIALTITCLPLLLHARQCRYYVLAPLLTLLVIDAYLSLLERPSARDKVLLIVWVTALMNSFFPAAVFLGIALAIDLIKRRTPRETLKSLAVPAAIVVVINLPMAWFCRIWDRRFGGESGHPDLAAAGIYLLRYLLTLNNYFFPGIVAVAACATRARSLKTILKNELNFLLLTICVTQLIGFSIFSDYPFTRYLIGIAPFIMYFGASCIETLSFGRRSLVWPIAAVLVGTNLFQILPLSLLRHTDLQRGQWSRAGIDLHFIDPKNVRFSYARGETKALIDVHPGFPFLDYLHSLVRPPSGPIDLIVDYLQKNAGPSDRVKITYGDLPLMFHTDLAITSSVETGPPACQWIISRHFRPLRTDDEFFRQSSEYRYSKITIPFPDLQWNNQPDPLYHYFDTPSNDLAPPITILKKL